MSVDFIDAKNKKGFLGKSTNDYLLTLRADSEPPCDLDVLVSEGTIPLDLTNYASSLTIPHGELADGKEHEFKLSYSRADRRARLYLRVIPADRDMPLAVKRDTKTIN